MLLCFISLPLSLGFGFLSFNFGLFSLISKSLSLLQLLLQSYQLLLRSSQLVISLTCQLPLALSLPLSTLQGYICAFSSLLLGSQFIFQIGVAVFSNGQGLHSSSPPFLLFIQLLIEGVGHLLEPKCILNSLETKGRNEYYIKLKKKKKQQGRIRTYHAQKHFGMKEDFTPPKTSQLHHIFGEQKGLLQRRSNMTPNAPIEVPN